MCGLSAWISEEIINETQFINYNNSIVHRGPDSSGALFEKFEDKYLAIGHRRLSIIDLENSANQPMVYNSYTIIFNGEIYNYLELKEELSRKGVVFRTHSDTEVLLHSFIEFGPDCLNQLNGMFSFLIYDSLQGKVFFARDRFGIKPLYYYRDKLTLYFASEIKQFITLKGFKTIANINAIGNFVDNRYLDYSEETFFRNVYQVRPGEAGFVDLASFHFIKYKWYNLEDSIIRKDYNFKTLFEQSIVYRLRSDVEVGSCLSGGIDSNSIVFVADKKYSDSNEYSIQTFTSCFEDLRFDERELVNITKSQTRIKPHFLFPNNRDFFKDIKELTYYHDEPIWSASIYAQSCVFKSAKKAGVKVMLDGQGADEVFCGYSNSFYPTYFYSLNLFSQLKEIFKGNLKALRLFVKKYLLKENSHKQTSVLETEYDNRFKNEFTSLKEHTQHFINYHLPALLHYEDRNSMRHSIESRLPFLDYLLVEMGFNIPDYQKIGRGEGKKIIRESMHGIIPDQILLNKVKKGFVTPQIVWMNENRNDIIKSIKSLYHYKIFKEDSIEQLLSDFELGSYNLGLIFRLYSLSIWMEVFKIGKVK